MTRSLMGVAIAMLMGASNTIWAEPAAPRVTVTRNSTSVTVTLQAQRLRVTQASTRDAFTLDLAEGADHVRITGNVAGNVTIRRGSRHRAFVLPAATPADLDMARRLVGGSPAVRSFERLMTTAWAQTRGAVAATAIHGLVRAVQGDDAPLRAAAARFQIDRNPRLRQAQLTGLGCIEAFWGDIQTVTAEYNDCMAAAQETLFPMAAYCGYSYNIKVALIITWLHTCVAG